MGSIVIYLTQFERQVSYLSGNILFFYCGEGSMENQQIVLNNESTVTVVDGENELVIQNVRKIELKLSEHGKIKFFL